MGRIILHIDMDCFFAAVEARDNPEYKGKPLIVGADPKEGKGRGVVATCSYEARRFGINSATPISQAYKLCPHAIFVRPNSAKYGAVSKKVMNIIKKYSKNFQQVGSDEAYLEITDICSNFEDAKKIAENIKNEIYRSEGITCSIGCAPTKTLAKISSDHNKPNGITVVEPENIKSFLENMDITRIPGIGKKTKSNYYNKGIKKIGDFIKIPLPKMIELFGKSGKWIWEIINGLNIRPVQEFRVERKSISRERTFLEDTDDFKLILTTFEEINKKIHKKIIKHNIFYKTMTLKIRFQGFITFTRSKSLFIPIQNEKKTLEIILELFKEFSKGKRKIRLIGIKLSNLDTKIKFKQRNLLNFLTVP